MRGWCRVVLVEAAQMLGSFDVRLRQYAASKLIKAGVQLKKGMVKEMFAQHVVLQVHAPVPRPAGCTCHYTQCSCAEPAAFRTGCPGNAHPFHYPPWHLPFVWCELVRSPRWGTPRKVTFKEGSCALDPVTRPCAGGCLSVVVRYMTPAPSDCCRL